MLQVTETPAQSGVDHKHLPSSARQEAWHELWVPDSSLLLLSPHLRCQPRPCQLCPRTPNRGPSPRLSLMFHWPGLSHAYSRPITGRGVVTLRPIRSSHSLEHLLCGGMDTVGAGMGAEWAANTTPLILNFPCCH